MDAPEISWTLSAIWPMPSEISTSVVIFVFKLLICCSVPSATPLMMPAMRSVARAVRPLSPLS
ncbi:hypothetical protein D3C71_2239120 [compost metagenome]